MNKQPPDSTITDFLDEVTDQISYQPLRPSIRQELEAHIEDRTEDYESQGFSPDEARCKAVRDMGDAIKIGTELNEAHQIQSAPHLIILTVIMLFIGLSSVILVRWTPEQYANKFLYYLPGGLLLILTAWKGFPLFLRYRKHLGVFAAGSYSFMILWYILSRYWNYPGLGLLSRMSYFFMLMFIPVFVTLLYYTRKSRFLFITSTLCCIGGWILFTFFSTRYIRNTGAVIFLLSTFATVCFMIYHGMFPGLNKYLYCVSTGLLLFLGSLLTLTGNGQSDIKAFLDPQSAVQSTWDDTYNSILIQELLSKTPIFRGIDLSSEEMMDYGTGAWYFADRDPLQISIDAAVNQTGRQLQDFKNNVDNIRAQGGHPRYIYYQVENVTLWDILPQHYHNNYLISLIILLFGWLPGLILIGGITFFYMLLFSCITKIQGKLASVLAFACGQCLLWQGILYLLGNLGYQYATFPNLPLISEGRLSILVNMLLLGMIYSAYRYDHVMEEPIGYDTVRST